MSACNQELYQTIPIAHEHTITRGDTIYIFSLLNEHKQVDTQYERTYTWFSKGAIAHAQGAYVGKLLDGAYTAMLRDNTLLEKGTYHMD